MDTHWAAMLADVDTELTFDGEDYDFNDVALTSAKLENLPREIAESVRRVVAVKASAFDTEPDQGDKVTIDTVVYRIRWTTKDPVYGLDLRLYLGGEFE